MNRERIRLLFKELSDQLGINDRVRLELRFMRTKAASVSIRRKVVRLNKGLIEKLQEDSLKYLILHELVHLKLQTTYHDEKFYNLIHSIFDENKTKELEGEILASLIEMNRELGRNMPMKNANFF